MTARTLPKPTYVAGDARRRLRPVLLPILQTALAATTAWWLAVLLLPTDQPTFASIAAVICLGASYGQRRQKAVELLGGVVLGIAVADAFLFVAGTGPLQIGLLVIIAMVAATVLRGGELLVNEAAISAILLATLDPNSNTLSVDRVLEGLIGGTVALVAASMLFPPKPVALAGRAAQRLFGDLGDTLEQTAQALADGDPKQAERALASARGLDETVDALEDELVVAGDTARFSPPRRADRAVIRRYVRTTSSIDFATRNARVLARHSLRYARSRLPAPEGLPEAIRQLAAAVRALAAQYEDPARSTELRRLAIEAAAQATEIFQREPDLAATEIVAQVRSLAVDLVRAADLLTTANPDEPTGELLAGRPTEELLVPAY